MNRSEFSSLIRNPGLVGRTSLNELREVLQIFPWFQSAHLLMLKGLRNTDDVKFDIQLRESAPHISDRARLYYLLNSQDHAGQGSAAIAESVEELAEPDRKVGAGSGRGLTEPVKDISGEGSTRTIESEPVIEEEPVVVPRPEDVLRAEIEKRLEEIDRASHEDETAEGEDPLLELDGLTSQTELYNTDVTTGVITGSYDLLEIETVNPVTGNQKDLIDRFIVMNPRLEVSRDRESLPSPDLSEPHTMPRIPFASETLAKIYVEQGYYSRAIDIYDKLCLKYPEKSSYFAAQIEMINDLIKNG